MQKDQRSWKYVRLSQLAGVGFFLLAGYYLAMIGVISEKQRKTYRKKVDDECEKLYLIHHMHHFKSGKNIEHELHHCFLFAKKNMKGKKYSIAHKSIKKELLHCITGNFEGILYDHANNVYEIISEDISRERISVIKI